LAYPKNRQVIGEDEFDSKIAELSRTVKVNPQNVDAFRNRGLLYGRKGEYTLALSDLDRAILLNPNDARASFGFSVAALGVFHRN
jgi:regulator of sirC expression with transglutaminase-like and TPR domain